MVKLGETIEVNGNLYEVVRTVRINSNKVIPVDLIEELKNHWHVDKAYRKDTTYYFVNEVKTIIPDYERPAVTIEHQSEQHNTD